MNNEEAIQGEILIVDDVPANLQLLTRMLTEHGYKVRAVRSGPMALAVARAAPPDLILLDILMPGMDGYEVCRRLKADELTRHIPVLFLSALEDVEDKTKAFAVGGVDYITKPFQLPEVLARVSAHLALHRLSQELEQANAQLAWQIRELEARNEELDAFSHTVAHDIKGPLTMIIGHAELLSQYETLPEAMRLDSVEALQRGVSKIVNIVDELLLLANVRKAEVALQPLDMGRIVREACARLEHTIRAHEARLTIADTWPVALGHAPWVEEVWVNYISNACEYGGRPPCLELGYSTDETLQGAPAIRFWVRDNGDGIPLEDQSRLFVPFTKMSQVRIKGHGLGLSIVQRIASKLGGEVGVVSEGVPGRGSLFYFTLLAAQVGE